MNVWIPPITSRRISGSISTTHRMRRNKMKACEWLKAKGLTAEQVEELLPLLPAEEPEYACGWFYNAERIMVQETWFSIPPQTRFVFLGQCPNGDGIAIDVEDPKGSIHYISHDMAWENNSLSGASVCVAESIKDFAGKCQHDDFPIDFWEARSVQAN
jgi:hypothetical protein